MTHIQYFFQQLDPVAMSIGLGCGLLLTPFLVLLFVGRIRRQFLVTQIRFDRLSQDTEQQQLLIDRLRQERDILRQEHETLGRDNAGLRARCSGMANQLEERELLLAATQRQVEQRFELLASEILTEKSSLINHQHESTLKLLLSPFHKQLQEFQHKVDDVYDRETRDRVAITTEIQHLRQLNERLSNDAVNLTEALQGKNKLQGQWGEMVLEKILEESGLRKGVEYTTQVSLHTESGSKRQPDVIVHLPGKRDVIIDAKVSLKAFTQAHSENDEKRRRKYELRHLDSVKRHVTSLSSKQYHQLKGVSSMDFVLLFIPIETAFQKTLENDPEILSRSMRKQVVLCSPSTLLAILRTIQHLWRLDEQNRNGLIIAKQAGNLYDKFVGFIETFEEIGTRLHQSQQAWHLAKKRLSSGNGNLIKRAEYLKELGVQTDRELTEALKQTTRSQGEIS
ncbi:DNA recombination protein RmuC [Desulfogranum marinum]|uniref:DNA recombination protein RmuC n=1 Tax=Desulfogranum marinum TaxID=453220 RepID=UPI0019636A1A|nr:DNA recombination protein RmuC [Desulfogranum marinum]